MLYFQNLYLSALQGGAQACSNNTGQITVGSRGDFVVLDPEHPRLMGRSRETLLDSWIFSGNDNPVDKVLVAGQKRLDNQQHVDEENIRHVFAQTLKRLSAL